MAVENKSLWAVAQPKFISPLPLVLSHLHTLEEGDFFRKFVKFLLIRKATRTKVLLSKYITAVLFSVYFVLLYLVLSVLLGMLLFGFQNTAESGPLLTTALIDYADCLVETIMTATFAFMLSAVFRSTVLSVGLTFVIILGAKGAVQLLAHYDVAWGRFLLFSNTGFGQYARGNMPLFEGMSPSFTFLVLLFHLLSFLGLAWAFFVKRDVAH
ncbi:ABC transporter permease [Bacillus sp. FJAT-42376]|uniref:ABC transporter permease n=1 Tax=Bacillus sp. FJAT-42376 TaxID=2014076 RepID=UPI000F4FDEAE|nr:ABC transporter permease [Bacillus sp. FJAT-42376]AZB41054.1 ABC transporter permease [Bacillus sp. FJAT-42376]